MAARSSTRWPILFGVDLALEDTDIGEIAIFFIKIQAVTHDELVGDLGAGIVCFVVYLTAAGLIQQRDGANAVCAASAQIFGQRSQRAAAVDNVLDKEDVDVLIVVPLEVQVDLELARGCRARLVGRDLNEIQLNGDV